MSQYTARTMQAQGVAGVHRASQGLPVIEQRPGQALCVGSWHLHLSPGTALS